jgi:hypothetical protein
VLIQVVPLLAVTAVATAVPLLANQLVLLLARPVVLLLANQLVLLQLLAARLLLAARRSIAVCLPVCSLTRSAASQAAARLLAAAKRPVLRLVKLPVLLLAETLVATAAPLLLATVAPPVAVLLLLLKRLPQKLLRCHQPQWLTHRLRSNARAVLSKPATLFAPSKLTQASPCYA